MVGDRVRIRGLSQEQPGTEHKHQKLGMPGSGPPEVIRTGIQYDSAVMPRSSRNQERTGYFAGRAPAELPPEEHHAQKTYSKKHFQMKRAHSLILVLLLGQHLFSAAAVVDSIDVRSAAMNKTYKVAVVLPASYSKNKAAYPVLYLLHGGGGHFRDWLISTPDKMLVKNLADQYNLIIVMPEGETFSWYLDSPSDKTSQFETYLTREVIEKIDATYRTVRSGKGRVITGLSMGGHGALFLSTRHPDLFCAAGSMSGALDLNTATWKIPPEFSSNVKQGFQRVVGDTTNAALYAGYSVVHMADKMKTNGLKLIIDCGVDDFLIEPNRDLHRRLTANGTPHDYIERPGAHDWTYWNNALPYQVLFFDEVFQNNGVKATN